MFARAPEGKWLELKSIGDKDFTGRDVETRFKIKLRWWPGGKGRETKFLSDRLLRVQSKTAGTAPMANSVLFLGFPYLFPLLLCGCQNIVKIVTEIS